MTKAALLSRVRLSQLELNADKAYEEFRRSNGLSLPLCPTCSGEGNGFSLRPLLVVSGAGLKDGEFHYLEWVCDNGHTVSAAVLLGLVQERR